MAEIYLLLGSNLANRAQNIADAINHIGMLAGAVKGESSLYETTPWGLTEQNDFLNKAISIETKLSAVELLGTLKQIEAEAGRTFTSLWGPRVIDIDILFYGNEIINLPELTIPHPFIAQRKFTLEPLYEIAPDFIHPVLKKTIKQLLVECSDKGSVKRLKV